MKPSIPAIQTDPSGLLGPIKENIETITGRRGKKIAQLSGDVSLESAIAKINEILTLLQDTTAGTLGESVTAEAVTIEALTATTLTVGSATAETITAEALTADELVAGNFVGMIAFFGASASIPGWLKTDGATYSTADYPALAGFLGAVGDTFAVPDIRGEFLRVLDDGRGVDAGRLIGSAQAQDIQPHTHTSGTSTVVNGDAGTVNQSVRGNQTTGVVTGSTGTTETRPRNVAYPAYIKT